MKKLLVISTLLAAFVLPYKAAAELDFYGSVNLGAWWLKYDRFYDDVIDSLCIDTIWDTVTWIPDSIIKEPVYGSDTLPGTIANFLPFGKFGCKYKADRVEACIEFGLDRNVKDERIYGNETKFYVIKQENIGLCLRKWYFTWFINDYFEFLAGQDFSPTNLFGASNQAFWKGTSFSNIGALCTGLRPMLQISIHDPDKKIEGKIAATLVDTTTILYDNSASLFDIYEREWKIPKFEGSFSLNLDWEAFALRFQCAGGYQTFKSVYYTSSLPLDSLKTDVNSYVVGGDIGLKLWNLFTLSYDVFYGQNIGVYGVSIGDPFGFWRTSNYSSAFYPINIKNSSERLLNGKATAMCAVLGFRPAEIISFEAGFGTVFGKHEYELYDILWTQNSFAWYFQTELTVVDKIKFTPEIGQYIYGPKAGFGRYLYGGLRTGVDF